MRWVLYSEMDNPLFYRTDFPRYYPRPFSWKLTNTTSKGMYVLHELTAKLKGCISFSVITELKYIFLLLGRLKAIILRLNIEPIRSLKLSVATFTSLALKNSSLEYDRILWRMNTDTHNWRFHMKPYHNGFEPNKYDTNISNEIFEILSS